MASILLLFIAYVAFSMTMSGAELPPAVLTALAGAGFAAALRANARDYRVPLHGLIKWLPRMLAGVPRDVLRLSHAYLRALAGRAPEGRETLRPFNPGPRTAAGRGRRGVVIWGLSLAPNAFVTGVDYAHDKIVLHELLPAEPSGDPQWPS
jgi:hypothetical protein